MSFGLGWSIHQTAATTMAISPRSCHPLWSFDQRAAIHYDPCWQVYPPGDCGDDGKVWRWGYDGTSPGLGRTHTPHNALIRPTHRTPRVSSYSTWASAKAWCLLNLCTYTRKRLSLSLSLVNVNLRCFEQFLPKSYPIMFCAISALPCPRAHSVRAHQQAPRALGKPRQG